MSRSLLLTATIAAGFELAAPLGRPAPPRAGRRLGGPPQLQYSAPKSRDDAVAEQAERLAATGMTPKQIEEATRAAATEYIASRGAHVSQQSASGPPQDAKFIKKLWGVGSVAAVPPDAADDPTRVLATLCNFRARDELDAQTPSLSLSHTVCARVHLSAHHITRCADEIGGPLTGVLSAAVAKELPLIPHIGIRLHGTEWFYSDHIECRSTEVMNEMLGSMPKVTIDLGPSSLTPAEVEAEIEKLEPEWQPEGYDVFERNVSQAWQHTHTRTHVPTTHTPITKLSQRPAQCVHFAVEFSRRCCSGPAGCPQPLAQGALDVSERMLDSLPEWRRALGKRVMNEVTRLVVVSWGKATKEKKEKVADSLGVDRGA